MFESKEKKIEKLKKKIAGLEGKDIPKTKLGLLNKLAKLYKYGATYGLGKESINQLLDQDLSLKNLFFGALTGPITATKDIIKGAGDYMQGKADGGMMEARKKGMGLKGLKMNTGGMVPNKFKGFSKLPESVQENMSPALAKKYNKGGAVKKRVVKRKPKSRGTGAAVRGTKFKGVF
jgi:hypothetical protein